MEFMFTNAVNISKDILKKELKTGDTAVDATCGNGNDTVFMAQLVGECGKIYSFDIQKNAIENTRENLKKNNSEMQVELICDSHINIKEYIKTKVKVVMFNLGYLPGGDHSITTKVDTTMVAIKNSIDLLDTGGIILIISYPGHTEGRYENQAIISFTSMLDQKLYNAAHLKFTNQVNNPPELTVIEKRK